MDSEKQFTDEAPKKNPRASNHLRTRSLAADRRAVLESIWIQLDALESLSRQLGVAKMEEELVDFVNLIRSRLGALDTEISPSKMVEPPNSVNE